MPPESGVFYNWTQDATDDEDGFADRMSRGALPCRVSSTASARPTFSVAISRERR